MLPNANIACYASPHSVKLLLDQNLSHRLLPDLHDAFPESSQVRLLGLDQASDADVWNFAKRADFSIVTKDADFLELSMSHGYPPKVIWLNIGNVPNSLVRATLLRHRSDIVDFLDSDADGILKKLQSSPCFAVYVNNLVRWSLKKIASIPAKMAQERRSCLLPCSLMSAFSSLP